MSPAPISGFKNDGSFPRVSGDEPSVIPGGDFAYVFSPRERG